MHPTHTLSSNWLILCLCIFVLFFQLTSSDTGKRGQRRVVENFDQDDDDDLDQYYSDGEFDLPRDVTDNGDEIDADIDTSEVAWNDVDGEDREDSDDEDFDNPEYSSFDEVDIENEEYRSSDRKFSPDPQMTITESKVPVRSTLDAYLGEMLMAVGICVYLLCFLIGRARGERMITAWFEANSDLLYENFSLVGVKDNEHKFLKEREDIYRLWCSGRVGCDGMMFEINLDKRHDLISRMVAIIKSVPDKITITAMLPKEETEHIVFALSTKKQLSRMLKEYEDLIFFASTKVPCDRFGFSQGVLVSACESQEAISSIISTQIAKIIETHFDCFESLHISDQYIGTKADNDPEVVTETPSVTCRIILKLNVPAKRKSIGSRSADMAKMLPMTHLALMLIDRVRKLKLSKETHMKTQKNRAKFQEGQDKKKNTQRMEAAQKKKEEKAKAAHDALMQETDPNKAKKMEEKDRKKQMKKTGVQAKIVKVK
ncbi:Coiled-coil domain-containing protein 47-like [Oopsacas minuta]|uniref:PAT complex subunit CCDC47 n=1 Tax=Oopsacas minuta TaxID=111878 RepID=A0AAV7JSR4_9METZ|nr:Coiled-coil domain-containing protein 47-like [Oopsacas minuta]